MPRILLCLALTLACTVPVRADSKTDSKGATKGKVVEAADDLRPGDVSGTVVSNDGKTLVLRMEYESVVPNGNPVGNQLKLAKEYQDVVRAQQQLAQAKNPRQALQAQRRRVNQLIQLANQAGGQKPAFKTVKSHIDYEIDLDDSVAYRTLSVPTMYDDKGSFKQPTAEELKKLKGDPKLPGYEATAAKAGKGAEVTVQLRKNKETEQKLRATLVIVNKTSAAQADKPKSK